MLVFPSQLVAAAKKAGIAVPNDAENFSNEAYPHFTAFCSTQLGRSIVWGEEQNNAMIIAQIPIQRIRLMTYADFSAIGVYPTAATS